LLWICCTTNPQQIATMELGLKLACQCRDYSSFSTKRQQSFAWPSAA